MLIDGLHKAPLTSSGRSLPHPHALLLSLIVSSFRPCLGGAQSTAYRNVAQTKSSFTCTGCVGNPRNIFIAPLWMVPGVSELKRFRVFPVSVVVSVGFSI